jgi:DNA replication protein DnaC
MKSALKSTIKDPLLMMLFNMGVPYNYLSKTINNYKGSKKLIADIKKALDSPCGLYFCGPPGSGKTHLLASCMHIIIGDRTRKYTGLHAQFRSIPALYLEIKSSFSKDYKRTINELVEYYSYLPYLFLDDLGAERITDFTIETLYIILNNRISNSDGGLRTFITSNYNLLQLQDKMDDRISSRILEHCEVFKINKPDYRVKIKPGLKGD